MLEQCWSSCAPTQRIASHWFQEIWLKRGGRAEVPNHVISEVTHLSRKGRTKEPPHHVNVTAGKKGEGSFPMEGLPHSRSIDLVLKNQVWVGPGSTRVPDYSGSSIIWGWYRARQKGQCSAGPSRSPPRHFDDIQGGIWLRSQMMSVSPFLPVVNSRGGSRSRCWWRS